MRNSSCARRKRTRNSSCARRKRTRTAPKNAAAAALVAAVALAASARAQTPAASGPARTVVDRVALRYYAPETGGVGQVRVITERVLAFEARLEAAAEGTPGLATQERYVRAALERHVAEDLLAGLGGQDVKGAARTDMIHGVTVAEFDDLVARTRQALVDRVHGEATLTAAMRAEGIDESELGDLLSRRVVALLYVDRAITPVLHPRDDELREVFRTSPQLFGDTKFEKAKHEVEEWVVQERLRAAESAYWQTARTRVHLVYPQRVTKAAKP
jgi:hypothetical protein